MEQIVKVEALGKKYILGQYISEKYGTLSGTLTTTVKNLFRKRNNNNTTRNEEFWAVKNISFNVKPGERIGIIGKNGAGKSTILKLISRITEPSEGRITLRGRVASLLEVGTGFHPELTGKENIFLNGSILGMSRKEIKRKFDEIVDFSGVEKFLSTPVKRYSSGMYVRLAFAVAAHLEPEILIVDEVLAVGDAEFQKKCIGKMQDVAGEGRTVIFVSHNMPAVIALCENTVLLSNGRMTNMGSTEKIVNEYLSLGNTLKGEITDDSDAKGKKLKIRSAKLYSENREVNNRFNLREKIFLEIQIEIIVPDEGYSIGFELSDSIHGYIFASTYFDADVENRRFTYWNKGFYTFEIELPPSLLREGDYFISIASTIPCAETLDVFSEQLIFRLYDKDNLVFKCGEDRRGTVMPILDWQISK